MAEVNAKDLTTKTTPASTDSMLLFGTTSNEGAKITVDNLADNILSRLSTKTFANQVGGSSAATLLSQLSTLNSKLATAKEVTLAEESPYISAFNGVYYSYGNLTVFVAQYTMAQNVGTSLALVLDKKFPIPMYSGYPRFPTHVKGAGTDEVNRSFLINANGNCELKGAHTAGATYYCTAAYITTYAN